MSREEKLPPPRADPSSYYGQPILKPPAWDWRIPAYLFAGGLSGGSTLLSVGADLTGRPALRRRARLAAMAGLGASTHLLVSDLGRPAWFHHMLRVAKPTSPMSVGIWIIAAYSPGIGLAAASEILPARWALTRLLRRAAGLTSAALARTFAAAGAVAELVASRVMDGRLGMVGEAYETAQAHRLRTWSEYVTAAGLAGTLLAAAVVWPPLRPGWR